MNSKISFLIILLPWVALDGKANPVVEDIRRGSFTIAFLERSPQSAVEKQLYPGIDLIRSRLEPSCQACPTDSRSVHAMPIEWPRHAVRPTISLHQFISFDANDFERPAP